MRFLLASLASRTRASRTRWSTSWANRLLIQRPLHSHCDVHQSRRCWPCMAVHQRTGSQNPHVRIGLEVIGSAGAHGAAQHR